MLLILIYHGSHDYETLRLVTYDYTCDIHYGMDDSLRCYIEMDNESLCGCHVLSYAPLCYFGDFHDYGL